MTFVVAPIAELHTLSGEGPKRGASMRDTGVLHNAGIAIKDEKVIAVGSSQEILKRFSKANTLDASNSLVTPGLVDCHTHLVWAGDRSGEFIRRCQGESYLDIAESGGGILATAKAVSESSVDSLTHGIIKRSQTCLSYGTTTLEIKASYGLSEEGCKKELDAIADAREFVKQNIVCTFMGAHSFPRNQERLDYLRLLEEKLIPMATHHKAKPHFNDVFCDVGAFTLEESEWVLRAGIKHGLLPKIHADEFETLGGVEMACALGAASCDHLLRSGTKQMAALAASNTVAVTMPGTAFYLRKGFADGRTLIDSDCILALGSDFNPGSSVVASMPFVMGLAVTHMGLLPLEALCAATINSAFAIGLKDGTGTLQQGSPADFCVWPVRNLEELVYEFTYIKPTLTFIRGQSVWENPT